MTMILALSVTLRTKGLCELKHIVLVPTAAECKTSFNQFTVSLVLFCVDSAA